MANGIFVETFLEVRRKLTKIFVASRTYKYFCAHYLVLLLRAELMAYTTDRNPNNKVK
jgi:hypothetical protein